MSSHFLLCLFAGFVVVDFVVSQSSIDSSVGSSPSPQSGFNGTCPTFCKSSANFSAVDVRLNEIVQVF